MAYIPASDGADVDDVTLAALHHPGAEGARARDETLRAVVQGEKNSDGVFVESNKTVETRSSLSKGSSRMV